MSRNVTIRVDEGLLDRARRRAESQNRSLNAVMERLLLEYIQDSSAAEEYQRLMSCLSHVSSGRRYTREEMNER